MYVIPFNTISIKITNLKSSNFVDKKSEVKKNIR